jgi:ADP-ribose pyrophosphatase
MSSNDSHLVERCLRSESVYDGHFLKARKDLVQLPNGQQSSREYIVHPGAVVIIPLLDDGRVVLERQYRYPVGQVMTEFPAGKLDPGEDPMVCARRELLEETGYTAGQWAYAGAMHLAIAYSTEVIHIFFARQLQAGDQRLDADEFLDVIALPFEDILCGITQGALTDAKTLTCALWLQNVVQGRWTLNWEPENKPDTAPCEPGRQSSRQPD